MHSKNFLTIFLLLFCFQLAIAQENKDDNEKRIERTKKVKMPKYYKAYLPKKSIAVADIQIVQAVPDSTRLGFLQKGMDNHKVIAVPAENLTILLQDYITKQYENDYKTEGIKLLLVVKNLRINERTFFSTQRAFARLHANAYISKDGNLYHFVTTVDTVQVYGSAIDVTSSHGENIAAALHKLIVQSLNKAESSLALLSEAIAFDSVISNIRNIKLHPIQKASRYREGVYLGFQEFLLNDPSLKNYDVEPESIGTSRIFAINPDSTKKEIIPWGLCKKGELYKYHENSLVPIEKYGNEFMISDYIDQANRRNQSLFAGAFMGGLVGAAIANSSAPKLYSVTAIPYITKKQPEASVIDMRTGEFTF
jgi:hypothetical protein